MGGNPIVGHFKLKGCVRLPFRSGQSFETGGLSPEGSLRAAELRLTAEGAAHRDRMRAWLAEARVVKGTIATSLSERVVSTG